MIRTSLPARFLPIAHACHRSPCILVAFSRNIPYSIPLFFFFAGRDGLCYLDFLFFSLCSPSFSQFSFFSMLSIKSPFPALEIDTSVCGSSVWVGVNVICYPSISPASPLSTTISNVNFHASMVARRAEWPAPPSSVFISQGWKIIMV